MSKFKNYLMATIKVPIKVDSNGEFHMLDNYAEIGVEPMPTTYIFEERFDSIYGKMIEYIHANPSYLTSIVAEGAEGAEGTAEGMAEGTAKKSMTESDENVTDDLVLHKFLYFKKSKKPLSVSFRNKGMKHNFTKKNYE